jgi:hypothetical protein
MQSATGGEAPAAPRAAPAEPAAPDAGPRSRDSLRNRERGDRG